MMVNIAEKVPCDLKDCIYRRIPLVGGGSDWHLILSHLVEHSNFKAEFIQICFQFSTDFIQPSFHLFCGVAIT